MDTQFLIWLLGSLIVILSWFGQVSPKVGWIAFLATTAIMMTNHHEYQITPFWWLWLTGLIVLAASWLFNWHRAVMWTGAFITFTAACMDLVAAHARQLIGDPVVFISPSLDMLAFSLILISASYFWFFVTIRNNLELIPFCQRRLKTRTLRRHLRRRNNKKRFSYRIELLSDIEFWTVFSIYEKLGTHVLRQSFVWTILLVAIAVNYYDTGISFNFGFFSVNWAWSLAIYLIAATAPINYLFDKYLDKISYFQLEQG